jgi:hypothetical protein
MFLYFQIYLLNNIDLLILLIFLSYVTFGNVNKGQETHYTIYHIHMKIDYEYCLERRLYPLFGRNLLSTSILIAFFVDLILLIIIKLLKNFMYI